MINKILFLLSFSAWAGVWCLALIGIVCGEGTDDSAITNSHNTTINCSEVSAITLEDAEQLAEEASQEGGDSEIHILEDGTLIVVTCGGVYNDNDPTTTTTTNTTVTDE